MILTVTGDIGKTNAGDAAEFDLEMLASLPETRIVTSTPWTDGEPEFTGVALRDFLTLLEVGNGTLYCVALNDYSVEIPVSDAWDVGPIIAYMRDGEPMSVRDKGPLWVLYDFDAQNTLDTDLYYNRSIWQLHRIEVKGR